MVWSVLATVGHLRGEGWELTKVLWHWRVGPDEEAEGDMKEELF